MMNLLRPLFAAAALFVAACASAPQAEAQSSWDNIARIVVVGDLEGDYEKFADILRTAGLIDGEGDWSGGAAHLVQLGDIPDRGPNSRQIMDHLMRLERQANRAGGRVHALIGNHEAMNVGGDLRYVHPGEYAAFATRGSARLRDQYYRRYVDAVRSNPPPGGLPAIDEAFRAQFDANHPLGWVEHRQAWAPAGEYGRWVSGHNTVIRINDTLFLHAGIGPAYAALARDTMNDAVRSALRGAPGALHPNILTDEDGPLWYRGFALNAEEAERANLEAVLARHGVSRVVVGHTKRAATVLPRFDGRVIIADVAVPDGFSDPHSFLVIESGVLTTIHRGQRVPLRASNRAETCAYLAQIATLDPPNSPNAERAQRCAAGEDLPAVAVTNGNGG